MQPTKTLKLKTNNAGGLLGALGQDNHGLGGQAGARH